MRQNLTNLHNYTTNLRVKTGAHSRQTSVNASLALPNQSLRVEGSEGRQQLKAFRGERKKSASKQRREQAKILANLSSYGKIDENGYKIMYLSARAIGQSSTTKEYLQSVKQGDIFLPDGPVFLNPDSLIHAFKREVIDRNPEEFKIR